MQYSSDISLFWLLPWAIVVIALTFYFYQKKSKWFNELSTSWQWLLRILRMTSLFILGVLLIGLIFQAFNYRTENPSLVIAVDTSTSMLNYTDSNEVSLKTEKLIQSLENELGSKFQIAKVKLSSNEALDSLKFDNNSTDIAKTFTQISEDYYNANLGAVIVLSDGNYNTGNNPIYAAKQLGNTMVYTIGVGDTIEKRDHFIKNITANNVAFLNNKFPVLIDVEGVKMGQKSSGISIFRNGIKIASETISYTDGRKDFIQTSFILDAKGVGYQRYDVVLNEEGNEYNYQNNKRSFYVEIVDSRSKVLLVGAAPHPDLSALKGVLETDANLEVVSKFAKDWEGDLSGCDLLVIHEPGGSFTSEQRRKIKQAAISKLFVVGPNSTNSGLNEAGVNVKMPISSQLDDVQSSYNKGFQLFELSEEAKTAIAFFPPLKSRFGTYSYPQSAEILLYERVGPVVKKSPQIFFQKSGDNKIGVIYGEGIWKWKLASFSRFKNNNGFNELFQKVNQYLLVKKNNSPLRIELPARFDSDEEIIVNGNFYNEALEQITEPTINFNLKDEEGKERKLQFGAVGKGYRLNIGRLAPGKYEWIANTSFNGKKYSKSGFFIVENSSLEMTETAANHSLLNQLAENANGKFYTLKECESLIDELKGRDDLTSVRYQESSFNDLIDYFWLFFLLLITTSAEWFFRRYLGSY